MNIVSIMAHQDDELMCLGTMLKMKNLGHNLAFICLTDGSAGMVHQPLLSRGEAASVRELEMGRLAAALDAEYICHGEADEFLYDTPDTRMALIQSIRQTKADVIFTHNLTDYNVDHMTVSLLVRQCAMQAPFPMLKTDARPIPTTPAVFLTEPSGGFEFEPSHYVDITDVFPQKLELALYHKSQDDAFLEANGPGGGLDAWVAKAAERRGSQCNVAYAEAFRPMLSRGLVKPYSILP